MSEPRGGQQMALKSLGAQPVPHLQPQHLVVVVEGCREGGSLKALTLEPGPGRRVLPSGRGEDVCRDPELHLLAAWREQERPRDVGGGVQCEHTLPAPARRFSAGRRALRRQARKKTDGGAGREGCVSALLGLRTPPRWLQPAWLCALLGRGWKLSGLEGAVFRSGLRLHPAFQLRGRGRRHQALATCHTLCSPVWAQHTRTHSPPFAQDQELPGCSDMTPDGSQSSPHAQVAASQHSCKIGFPGKSVVGSLLSVSPDPAGWPLRSPRPSGPPEGVL